MSAGYFRIRWRDRLGALLLGKVPEVHASAPPVVFRRSHGGACTSIDHDALGMYDTSDWTVRCLDKGRPYLTVDKPHGWRGMACPCCSSVVHLDRIHRPHPERIALWKQLRELDGAA